MTNTTTPHAAPAANSTDTADVLSNVRGQLSDRIEELKPAVEEFHKLTAAVAALDSDSASPAPARRGGRRRKAS